MMTQTPQLRPRGSRLQAGAAWALVTLLVAATVVVVALAASAAPAGAVAAPVATAPSGSAAQPGPGAHQGDVNLAMVVVVVGLGAAIGAVVAGRGRIARERSIRRFRGQLRGADVVLRCQESLAAQREQTEVHEPPPPGITGS